MTQDTIDDAARFRFLAQALSDPEGAEGEAMTEASNELEDGTLPEGPVAVALLIKMIDLARAKVASS